MNKKTIIASALVAVATVVALVLNVHAQLRPCVWPNTCG